MTLTQTWQTASRPNVGSGYKRTGTFRDISLTRYKHWTGFIDAFDATCLERNCKRSELYEAYRTLKCDDFFEKLYANQKKEDLAKLSPLLRHTSDLRNLRGYCLRIVTDLRTLNALMPSG
jgi:hypothetical protein